jgi:TetR/AcrR family transcriptional regulator, repressor for uid operon
MPRVKNPQLHLQRSEGILAAAARIFKMKGFHAARTEDICADAGLSAGTVFRHFKTKQEMITAIAQYELNCYKKSLEQLASKDGLQWLANITENGVEELLRPTAFDLGTDSWLELARHPGSRPQLLEFDGYVRGLFARELEKGKADGWVRPQINASGVATLLLSILSGLAFDSEIGVEVDQAATAEALSDLVTNFILTNT